MFFTLKEKKRGFGKFLKNEDQKKWNRRHPSTYLLKWVEAIGFAQTHQVFQDGFLQFLFTSIHYYLQTFFKNLFNLQSFGHCTYQAFTHVLEGTGYALFLGPFRHDFRIWNYNSHQKRLESAEKYGLILFNNDQQGGAAFVCWLITCRLSPCT